MPAKAKKKKASSKKAATAEGIRAYNVSLKQKNRLMVDAVIDVQPLANGKSYRFIAKGFDGDAREEGTHEKDFKMTAIMGKEKALEAIAEEWAEMGEGWTAKIKKELGL